jgi:glucose/arabinose dehydrogenase
MAVVKFSRSHRPRLALISAAALIVSCVAIPGNVLAAFTGLTRVASGLSQPAFTTFAPGDPNRLFIATLGSPDENSNATATIRVLNLQTGTLQTEPYLSIPGINTTSEGGLLGLAFHPDFQNNHKFYAYVTANDSVSGTPFSSYIREYTAPSASSPTANPTFTPILNFTQPQANHNGGWIGFGPNDGYLYIASGDGGNGNDQGTGHTEPGGNAQDITSNFLGKILRIDVNRDDFTTDANRNYGIPHDILESPGGPIKTPGNPFAPNAPDDTDPTGDNEIWAYGLRNPFRAGFDRATGDLWIGDVGQGRREEIDFQPGSSAGGENYQWRQREGFLQTPGVGGAAPEGSIPPVWDYKQPDSPDITPADAGFTGQTVIGGVPYRGPDPTLQGLYFFTDTASNQIWTLRRANGTQPLDVDNVTAQLPPNTGSPNSPVAITEDANGNVYITYLSGSVYRINTDAFTPGDFNGDASVDGLDLDVWSAGFGMTGVTRTSGDADADGDVDGADFLAWQQNVGWSPLKVATAAASPVPEPRLLALLAAFAAIAGARSKFYCS